jgi:hypothetical protein
VELLLENMDDIVVGISRPNLNPTGDYDRRECTDGWFIYGDDGARCGNGKQGGDNAGSYKQGDRVGVLLDLDIGLLMAFAYVTPGFGLSTYPRPTKPMQRL